ncbi:MAG: hypothetical protein IT305_25350 [Chloroflexi bacterium]|nr:hypothetical protein [Chloroflexota bacterium]
MTADSRIDDSAVSVADDLETLSDRIEGLGDLRSADLRQLAGAVRTAGSEPGIRTVWTDIPLLQAFDAQSLAERVHSRANPSYIGLMELLRNALILVPVGLTWFGISEAMSAYGRVLADPSRRTITEGKSFLELWQTGIAGELPGWAHLSTLAFTSFILICCIVVLTLGVHWISEVREAGRNRHRQAERDHIRLTLTQAEHILAASEQAREDDRFAEQRGWFEGAREERRAFLGAAATIVDRLDGVAARQLEALDRQVLMLEDSGQTFERLLSEHASFGHDLRAGADTLVGTADRIEGLFADVHDSVGSLTRAVQSVDGALPPLTEAASRAAAGARDLVLGQRDATQAVADLTKVANAQRDEVRQELRRLAALSRELSGLQARVLDGIHDHAERLSTSAAQLEGILGAFGAQTDALVNSIQASTTAHSNAATKVEQLGDRIVELAAGQMEVVRGISQLGAQAERIPNTLQVVDQSLVRAAEATDRLGATAISEQEKLAATVQKIVEQAREALRADIEIVEQQAQRSHALAASLASVQAGAAQAVQDYAAQLFGAAAQLDASAAALDRRLAALESALAGATLAQKDASGALAGLQSSVERNGDAMRGAIQDGSRGVREAIASNGQQVQDLVRTLTDATVRPPLPTPPVNGAPSI